ncbi:Rho termination factor N-terminal domain-containing protein (plasmid) [Staphylococcus aureus]|uniref:Rho termination factor N-terminal domain-containing protein n=1 Tax=Staphylococcus aureus TaxID=1280 RepID=UPI0021CFD0FA|nr:Rho termination factor N-terminal domain-containing protein [Staphylococcus aureus]UXV54398.1 Rho termination factor N-terminal domain-containing protein [Staphylococcus aureus]UXV57110.1 Rho termination factor N-terminal domain-containing protein [Staphylococcus aureus]
MKGKYICLVNFRDIVTDVKYKVGDEYNHENVSVERLSELVEGKNDKGIKAIEFVGVEDDGDENVDLKSMKVAELKELEKQNQIHNYHKLKKAELIKALEGLA